MIGKMKIAVFAAAIILMYGAGPLPAAPLVQEAAANCWEDSGRIYCQFDGPDCDVESGATLCETLAAIVNYLHGTNWVADGVECWSGTLCSFHAAA